MHKLRPAPALLLCFLLFAGAAQAAMVYLKARLDGAQAGVPTSADGAAFITYDTSSRALAWTINYRNLSSTFFASHFHGPAAPGTDAAVQVPIAGSPSPLVGNATLTPAQEADLLAGLWYVNIHTLNYPNGEIRGQVSTIDTTLYTAALDGAQAGTAGSPIPTAGRGSGSITFDPATLQMGWNITYSGLSGAAIAAHFHGPANPFESAAALVPTATTSPITGSATLTASNAANLVNGFWYHNIHTASYPNGEIRGQVVAVHPHLGAISTRLQVLTGDNVLIGGFIIGGSTPKTVAVRARGPSLVSQGVAGALADPTMTVVPASGPAITNDDWGTAANAAQLSASGFAPANAKESALLLTLDPGAYTAVVSGVGNTTGVAIVEVYEVDHPDVPLTGISTRALVQTGDNVIIGGFIIGGTSPQTVVVRARGPSLASQGVANALANPTLQLVRAADNTTIAINDDWGSASNAAQLSASGFAPANALESAVLVTLDPGAYTAIVSGVGGTTGVGIVEIFSVP